MLALHIFEWAALIFWIALALAGALVFRWSPRFVAGFTAIQMIGGVPFSPLFLIGLPVCGALAVLRAWRPIAGKLQWRGGRLTWLWGNLENGIVGPGMTLNRWSVFYWSALRNSVNNLRYMPGISKVGRPYWRKTWGPKPGGWYAHAGWNNSGFPVLSGGRNINPW